MLMIYFNILKVFIENLMEEFMGKIIKEIVCENGDCSNKRIRVLPLIGFITVNAIVGVSLSMFCYHIVFN